MKYLISFALRFFPRPFLQRVGNIGIKILSIFYIGKKVECVICTHRYRKFMPYGRLHPRKNALCPNCLSLERHRLIWLYLKDKTNFFSASLNMLHIAPEYCFIGRFKKLKNLTYTTADLESPLADVKMDIHHMPFEDQKFDVVFCNHVMEHVEDDFQAMREIYRVLKPGGWAIVQSPIDEKLETTYEDSTITSPREREKAFGQNDHVRMYGHDYKTRFGNIGFLVEVNQFSQIFSSELKKKYGLPEQEEIFVFRK